jgi:hypothetical protein
MKINVGRGVIERLACLTAIPNASGYSSQYCPVLSPEALERAKKNRAPRGAPKLDTTKLGIRLRKQGRTREQILEIVCQLHLGYTEMSPAKQIEVEKRIWKNILAGCRPPKKADNSTHRKRQNH